MTAKPYLASTSVRFASDMHRGLAPVLLIALLLASGASADVGTTIPQGGGANNVVLVQSSGDGSTAVRANTQVSQVGGPTVASSNIAAALATDCTGCHSTSVAVQVVFVTGAPQYFVPGNSATAVNAGCTECGSFAYAWQLVVQADRPLTLSAEAHQQMQTLTQEIADTAASIVPDTIDDDLLLNSELDALTSQLVDLVNAQAEQAGIQATATVEKHVRQDLAG
jgi:hypothetical protein